MSPPTTTDADIHHPPTLPPVPALPEPVGNEEDHHVFKTEEPQQQHVSVDAVAIAIDHATAALAVGDGVDHNVHLGGEQHQTHNPHHHHNAHIDHDGEDPSGLGVLNGPKKRNKKLPLTFHEALTFASRGIYVDIESNQLRCSCNHKPCDKWDAYGYTRHFGFKCHKKYEEERLDDAEIARLREAKETYMRMNPIVEEASIRKKRKMKEGEKILSVEELRVQERHWMEMWKDAKNELKQLRQDLKEEMDEEIRGELVADIDGLKRRKGDWAKLLGLNDHVSVDMTINL